MHWRSITGAIPPRRRLQIPERDRFEGALVPDDGAGMEVSFEDDGAAESADGDALKLMVARVQEEVNTAESKNLLVHYVAELKVSWAAL